MFVNGKLRQRFAVFVIALVSCGMTFGAEFVLSDFNNSGFGYTFNFGQTVGPNAARVTDLTQGWGGAGFSQSLDLSSFANARVVVDFETHPLSSVSEFTIELIDGSGNSGKWPFPTQQQPHSQLTQRVHQQTLSNPVSGVGNPANLDLSDITSWQVLGEWNSSSPFDISFDQIGVSTTATPTSTSYPGRDLNAAWRAVAASRIDQYRKADLQINVVDLNGVSIPNATVNVGMQQHEFGFGSAVQAARVNSNSSQNQIYKNKIKELFNKTTIENGLKWPPMEGEWGNGYSTQQSVSALNWIDGEGIDSRGHVMVWPGYSNLPSAVQAILDNDAGSTPAQQQQALRDAISDRISSVAAATSGLITDWDVVNEIRSNNDVMNLLPEGDAILIDWFQQAAAAAPDATLLYNEFGILTSGGGTNTGNQQQLIASLNDLVTGGAPIDSVGLQSHFTDTQLTGPEDVWTILDNVAATGVDIQITEFDHQTNDQQLQADFQRDFMTAVFAHEDVTDFLFWGFYENAHWRPEAALFNGFWGLKPNGQAFMDLVLDEWWTDETLTVDIDGAGSVRGFKGDYEVEASYTSLGTITGVETIQLVEGGSAATIALDMRLGDFDNNGYACNDIDNLISVVVRGDNFAPFDITGDGLVDQADVDAWLTFAGGELSPGGGAFLYGDADLNGVVDAADFDAWNANRFQMDVGWCGGDFNADGITDVSDLNIWHTNRGLTSVVAVPEPQVAIWALLGFLMCFRGRRTDTL